MIGTRKIGAMLNNIFVQSPAYELTGTARKVIALNPVPKMLSPAAHHGTRPPPRKKSSVVFSRRENHAPRTTIAARYAKRTV